jgi:hypothetical protein
LLHLHEHTLGVDIDLYLGLTGCLLLEGHRRKNLDEE